MGGREGEEENVCVDVKECVCVGECERDCAGVRRRAGEKRTNLINERFFLLLLETLEKLTLA